MAAVAISSAIVGILLGLRLKYVFLVLAIAVALAAVAAFSFIYGGSFGWTAVTMFCAAAALQVGYLCGLAFRPDLAAVAGSLKAEKSATEPMPLPEQSSSEAQLHP